MAEDIPYLLDQLAAARERNEVLEDVLAEVHDEAQRIIKSANTPSQSMWLTVQHATGAAARIIGRAVSAAHDKIAARAALAAGEPKSKPE